MGRLRDGYGTEGTVGDGKGTVILFFKIMYYIRGRTGRSRDGHFLSIKHKGTEGTVKGRHFFIFII